MNLQLAYNISTKERTRDHFSEVLQLFTCVDNGRVILLVECVAYLLKAFSGPVSCQIHCHLPSQGKICGPFRRQKIVCGDAEGLRHQLLDKPDIEGPERIMQEVFQPHDTFSIVIEVRVELRTSDYPVECAFKFPYVAEDVLGNKKNDVIRYLIIFNFCLLLEYRNSCLSRSGGCMSVTRPHSKRETSLSSTPLYISGRPV